VFHIRSVPERGTDLGTRRHHSSPAYWGRPKLML